MSRELTSHRLSRTPSRQRGVGLPVAIFVITVLAAFVVNMGYLVQDNATGRIEYVQSLRALLAAESGGDLGSMCSSTLRMPPPTQACHVPARL